MKRNLLLMALTAILTGCGASEDPSTTAKNAVSYEQTEKLQRLKTREFQAAGALTGVVKTADQTFRVEVADTPPERLRGLMFREELAENTGMLFVFDTPEKHGFWMKNTLIPLDMVWISVENKIVDIKRAVPCVTDSCPIYKPRGAAKYVLEVNADTFTGAVGAEVQIDTGA